MKTQTDRKPSPAIKVLHLETGRNLYGGALQVQYLLEGLQARGVANVLAAPVGCRLAARAAERGMAVRELPMGGDLDLALIIRLIRVIRSERPDIVHIHSRRGADVLGGIAARWCGVPAVVSRRVDNPEPGLIAGLKYRLYRRVITISEGIRAVLLSEGVDPQRVVCVRSAVDTAGYRLACDRAWFADQFQLGDDTRPIAVVAQLIPRKGHCFLVEAMPGLLRDHPGVRLLLFGKGPEGPAIGRQVSRLGLDDRVIFAGFRDDLARILPCLEVVVLPSLTEGLGVALLQASSAGVATVASRVGGMPEAVRDGENGLLVPPGDSKALGDAIGRLLSDQPLARRMGRAGRALMEREFSIDVMVDGNLRVYRELLDRVPTKARD